MPIFHSRENRAPTRGAPTIDMRKSCDVDQYAVLGNPISHSLSPIIHHLFATQTHQALNYSALLVPLDDLEKTLTHFQTNNGKGVNITLPFKQQAFHLVNSCSERAQLAQAINTIRFNKDGSRYGDNTDGIGLIRDIISNHQYPIQNKRILILGAGGAARGIIAPLLNEQPNEIIIANRSVDKALLLAKEFSTLGKIQGSDFSSLENQSFDLIIHTTSAGLKNENLNLPTLLFRENHFCYDLSYGKKLTPFLQWATKNGATKLSDGLGMLVEQAAEAFFIWRRIKPLTGPVLKALNQNTYF